MHPVFNWVLIQEAMSYYSPSHPTQLAIDGSYFLPILTNLANDPKITGTVIVDLEVDKLNPTLTEMVMQRN